ncbi:MAG: hypothetical protein ACOCQR_03510 [bacterium]
MNTYGDVTNNKNLVHYLLKYRYVDNWRREVSENYFPIALEELYRIIPDEFHVVYKEHYTLPFIHNQIKKDFGIVIKDNIHLKMILSKLDVVDFDCEEYVEEEK